MTTLFVDQRGSRLSFAGGALEVRLPDETVRRVPVAQLDRVIIACEADIAVGLLRQLAFARVPLVVLRGRSHADAAMLWPHIGDARRRMAQRRVADSAALARRLVLVIVHARIRAQQRLLLDLRDHRPQSRYAVSRAVRLLSRFRRGLRRHATVDALRGAEGAAARVFFAAWATLLPVQVRFRGRRRRPPTDPANAALSLGYSLLHARVLEACHAAGLDAALGVLHTPEHDRPSLACDLVEFERAVVERWVHAMFAAGHLAPADFESSAAGCRLGKSGRGAFFAGIEPLLAAAQQRTRRRLHALLRWLDRVSATDAGRRPDGG